MHVRPLAADRTFAVTIDETVNDIDITDALNSMDSALNGARLVVLDCNKLARINSAGIGNMLRIKARLGHKGATLRLASLHPDVQNIMKLVRADLVFDIHPDVDAAANA